MLITLCIQSKRLNLIVEIGNLKDEIEEFKRTISERTVIQNGHQVTKKVEITFAPTNVDNYVEHGTAWDVYLA